MMDKERFIKTLTSVAKTYNKKMDLEQIAVWYSIFKADDIDVFNSAIKKILVKSKFMPTIADVKEEILMLTDSSYSLNAEDEYQKLLDYVHKGPNYTTGENYFETLNPITQKAIETIGKNYLMEAKTSDFENIRRDFVRYFNSYKNVYKDNQIANSETKKLIGDFSNNFKLKEESRDEETKN